MGQTQSGQLQLIQGVGVYVQINKDTLTAGEFLQGSVFLKAQKPTQINYIKLKFQCRESVSFVKISNEDSTSFNVQGIPYEHSFDISTLCKAQKLQGNKIFPFKILLPSELPGSIMLAPENYLRYILSAETKILGQKSIVKSNEVIVHLTEPFRLEMQSLSQSVTNYPQCCDCCQSYGTVQTKLSCSKNLIQVGQEIKIIAQIDASHARVPIRSWKISLIKHIFKGSPDGQKEYIVSDQLLLESFGSIGTGQKRSESVTKTIPGTYSQQSTSYGTILGVYYTIDISSEMGLFSKGANISVPIFFISSNPSVQKNAKIKTSSFSSPTSYPLFPYTNMKSYVYRPVQGMPLINRKNFNPQSNLFTMNNTYFGLDSNVYQIKKTKILTKDRSIERSEQDPADPDPDGKAKWTNSKMERPRKYMDEQNQEDYPQFKDFESNSKI